jgi:peptide/nickel transport system substrate-binding protein
MPRESEKPKSQIPSWGQFKKLPQVLTFKEKYTAFVLILMLGIALIAWVAADRNFNYEESADFGGSYTEGIIGQPKFVNPLLADTEGADADLVTLIYSGLLKYDERGNLIPDLAHDFKISEDGLIYTFWLRENIQWHDGEKFDADDVIFTINSIQIPDNQSPARGTWQNIITEKIDEQRIQIILDKPNSALINNLTIGILPEHLWSLIAARNFSLTDFNLQPIGTGPYKFVSFQKDASGFIKEFHLASNERYHLGKPYINDIIFKFYETGEEALVAWNRQDIDGISTIEIKNLNFIKRKDDLKINRFLLPRYFAVFFNPTQSKALVDKKVRMAIEYATDKKDIIKTILGGEAEIVNSPLPTTIFHILPENAGHNYNPTKAIEILEEIEWIDEDGDGWREKILPPDDEEVTILSIKLMVPARANLPEVASILKEQWEKIGVKTEIETVPVSVLQQTKIKSRDYEALIFGQALSLKPDPYIFWHSSRKKEGLNFAIYDNKDVDVILETIRETTDPEKQNNNLKKFQELIIEDVPVIFLYSPHYLYPTNENLEGIKTKVISRSANRFLDIQEWYIETKKVRKVK